jgi:hypothetical protein
MREEAEKTLTKVYKLGQVTYVPHYQDGSVYVRPGYGVFHRDVYTEKQLIEANAKPSSMMLWPRSRFGSIKV